MTQYKCQDCGLKAGKKFKNGQCPACDSFNIANLNATSEEKKSSSPISLALTVGLWGLLAYLLWKQFIA